MYRIPLLYLLMLITLSLAHEQNKYNNSRNEYLSTISPNAEDSEPLNIAASGSRNKKQSKTEKEEKMKTLSQQVADGKYGLIQKELFNKPMKRPGVLSYDTNSEVEKDNEDNLGGLDQNEIWLAENHLLVLRGGKYPPHENKKNNAELLWPSIDNYNAPLHQVKIPSHPKVPPPFPVQLTENGPLQILGTNSSRTLNETYQSSHFPLSSSNDVLKSNTFGQTYYSDTANIAARPITLPIPVNASGHYGPRMQFPPFTINHTLPPYLEYLPPGAVILPPPENQTELYDDDDPSIYYPSPYSFVYQKDNSSAVSAGPLVPGIILPPPPNFFAPLEETKLEGNTTIRKSQLLRKPTISKIHVQIHSTITSQSATTKYNLTTTEKSVQVNSINNYYTKKTETELTTINPKIGNEVHVRLNQKFIPQKTRKKTDGVTILRPIKQSLTPPSRMYTYKNEIPKKPFQQYGPPLPKEKAVITTTQVPLRYYTISNNVETNTRSEETEKYDSRSKIKTVKTTMSPPQYFFYEEPETISKHNVPKSDFPSKADYYTQPKFNTTPRPKRPQYIYVTARPYNTQKPRFRFIQQSLQRDTFSVHIAQLQNQIRNYYTTPRTSRKPNPKPVYQYSFEATNYQTQPNKFISSPSKLDRGQFRSVPKYNVEIQQAVEIIPSTETPNYRKPSPVYYHTSKKPEHYYTSTPSYQYEKVTQKAEYLTNMNTPRPISQYSFEITPNPIYQGYYTKPDEGFFDEGTKHYFTMFGRKIPATTSIPNVEITPSIELSYTHLKQHNFPYEQNKPNSLQDDTYINYVDPKLTTNPEADFVPVNKGSANYAKVIRYTARSPVYIPPKKKTIAENPEIIKAIPIEVSTSDSEGSLISYQLPGDEGAHFYFLTPQVSEMRDQGVGYYYAQSKNKRIRRNNNVTSRLTVMKKV